MEIKLSDGYPVTLDERHLNDWKLLKMLRGIDKGETSLIVDVAEALLGKEQVEALEKHLEVDGVTPIDTMVNAIREVMESTSSLKNS
ncbi:MAG: hypothetical protein IKS99_06840 [Firmicutes bacterium]|nr:hypothetical protein [Bacillota bacterium]